MFFTNSRTLSKKNRHNSKNMIYVVPHIPLPKKKEEPKVTVESSPNNNKIKTWGPYIWFMLHTLAEKVKKESFYLLRDELLQHIYNICTNLPCPSCSTHSKEYLLKVDMSKINTKEDLKLMLLSFHNNVNKRLNKPEFSYEQLNDKYKTANFNHIAISFFYFFEDKHRTVNMLSNDMFTKRVSNNIRTWLNDNIEHFE